MRGRYLGILILVAMLVSFTTMPFATAGSDVSAVLRAGGGAVGGAGFVMLTGVSKIVGEDVPPPIPKSERTVVRKSKKAGKGAQ